MASKIIELYEKLSMTLHADPSIERQLYTELARMVSNAHTQDMSSDEGYCFKFNLPLIAVNKLYKLVDLLQIEVFDAFKSDWGSPTMRNKMFADPYYQILVLIMFYGLKEKKSRFIENAFLVLLFKIWNGRKAKFFPKWCDKKIMKYVTSHMLTNRHLFAKFDSPLSMIRDHFMPTLLKKYGSEMIKDPKKYTKRIIEQSWGRVHQQFVQNMRTNIKTGTREAQSGILPLYKKAKEQGLSISNPSVNPLGDEEGQPGFSEFTTVSNRDEIINSTSDHITMNSNPKYTTQVINQINSKTRVSSKVIEVILKSLHNHRFHNTIHDLIGVILSKTNVSDKSEICSQSYLDNVQKNVISSKNNVDARKIQALSNKLLDEIFKNVLKRNFKVFSNVQQIQLRNVIIHGLIHNLRRNVCKGGSVTGI